MQFQFDEENKYLYFEDERCTKLTKKCLKSMYIAFFVVAVIFTILYSWFHNNYYIMTITGRSMQPTLNADIESQSQTQDMAIVDKDGDIDYGDIIIIKQPNNPNSDTTIIKRVLAFEGDKISLVKVRDENNIEVNTYLSRAGYNELIDHTKLDATNQKNCWIVDPSAAHANDFATNYKDVVDNTVMRQVALDGIVNNVDVDVNFIDSNYYNNLVEKLN